MGEGISPLLLPVEVSERDSCSNGGGTREIFFHSLCLRFGNGADAVAEVKRLLSLAGPIIATGLLQYCIQVISVMFVGHLSELSLSGASMATSFANVTGFSVLVRFFSYPHPLLRAPWLEVKDANFSRCWFHLLRNLCIVLAELQFYDCLIAFPLFRLNM